MLRFVITVCCLNCSNFYFRAKLSLSLSFSRTTFCLVLSSVAVATKQYTEREYTAQPKHVAIFLLLFIFNRCLINTNIWSTDT